MTGGHTSHFFTFSQVLRYLQFLQEKNLIPGAKFNEPIGIVWKGILSVTFLDSRLEVVKLGVGYQIIYTFNSQPFNFHETEDEFFNS